MVNFTRFSDFAYQLSKTSTQYNIISSYHLSKLHINSVSCDVP
jgi:hypothetical protein